MSNYPAQTAEKKQSPVLAIISRIRDVSEELKNDALSLEQSFGSVLDDSPKPEVSDNRKSEGTPIGNSLVERDLAAATEVMLEAKRIIARMRNNCRV